MKTKGILLTILSAVLFGFNPLLSKQIYALGGNSVTLSFFRMLITALAFWILNVIWLHEDFRVDGREFRKLFFCAQGYCLTPYLLWSSYNYLPSGLATTIHFVYPVLVLLGSIIFYHEGLTGKKAVSCIFCVAGIICLCHMDGSISMTGFLIAFASGVTYTSYILLLDHCGLVNIHPYKLSFWLSAIGAVELLIISVLTRNFTLDIAPVGWFLTLIFALLAGAVASTAFQLGTKYIGAQSASMLSTFEPLTSVLIGILVYHEVMTGRTAVGIAAILLSVIIVSSPDRKSGRKE